MQCVCCLLEADDKKKLTAFTAGDRKCYQELTRLELQAGNSKFKICPICKSLLRASTEFLRQCLKSHVDLPAAIIPPVAKSQRPKRKRDAIVEDLEPESQVSHLECSIADDPGSEDDELPISSFQKQLQVDEPEAFVEIPADVGDTTKQETCPDAKGKATKYQCTECDLCFSTSQRLRVHSFTHSGIKNWKCGECEKVFATKFRLKAHSRMLASFSVCARIKSPVWFQEPTRGSAHSFAKSAWWASPRETRWHATNVRRLLAFLDSFLTFIILGIHTKERPFKVSFNNFSLLLGLTFNFISVQPVREKLCSKHDTEDSHGSFTFGEKCGMWRAWLRQEVYETELSANTQAGSCWWKKIRMWSLPNAVQTEISSRSTHRSDSFGHPT